MDSPHGQRTGLQAKFSKRLQTITRRSAWVISAAWGSSCSIDDRAPTVVEGLEAGGGSAGAPLDVPAQVDGGGAQAGVVEQTGMGGAGGSTPVGMTDVLQVPGPYFESGPWRGYSWTSVDPEGLARVTSTFEEPSTFCFTGTIAEQPSAGGGGFAALGFNLNQLSTGMDEGQAGPVLELVPGAAGVIVTVERGAPPAGSSLVNAPSWRIELSDLSGRTWCAPLTTFDRDVFIRYEPDPADPAAPYFNTSCESPGTGEPYARQPIASLAVRVGGGSVEHYFGACVSGLGEAGEMGEQASGALETPFARAKVVVGGESYIINNAPRSATSPDHVQELRYTNNSFEVIRQSSGPAPDGTPLAFPSIFIGANRPPSGMASPTTSDTDNLPIRVGALTAIPTTFRHNAEVGDYNAIYEAWFSPTASTGAYTSAQSGYLMIWMYKPAPRSPVGSRMATVSIAGEAWGLYVGPRGGSGPDSNVPVISYVNEEVSLTSFSFDLNLFVQDAVQRNLGLTNDLFLTDIVAGFEIWDEGAGLRVYEFTAVVNP